MKAALVNVEKSTAVCKQCGHLTTFFKFVFRLPDKQVVQLEICSVCILNLFDTA